MKGTEKQVKWAEDIIANVEMILSNMIKECENLEKSREGLSLTVNKYTANDVEKVKEDLMAKVNEMDAGQIIDKRNVLTNKNLLKATAVKYHNQ